MAKNSNKFIVTNKQAQWIASAVAKNDSRPILQRAAIAYYQDHAVLVSTDTHRLHILYLKRVKEPFETFLLDIGRVVSESTRFGASRVEIDLDKQAVTLLASRVRIGSEQAPQSDSQFDNVLEPSNDRYPCFEKAIPSKLYPLSEFYAINWEYFRDACALSSGEHNGVMLRSGGGETPPILIAPLVGWTWEAVVKPLKLVYQTAGSGKKETE